jgi:hypothetical protein
MSEAEVIPGGILSVRRTFHSAVIGEIAGAAILTIF